MKTLPVLWVRFLRTSQRALRPRKYLKTFSSWILSLSIFLSGSAEAAITLSTHSPVLQDFNTLGTAAAAPLPTDWKADKLTAYRTVGNYASAPATTGARLGANIGYPASPVVLNCGAGTPSTWVNSTDRAIGFNSTGANGLGNCHSGNLYVHLKAPSDRALTGLLINYVVEKYRNGMHPHGWRIQLFYSFDGASWTSAGENFLTAFAPDADNAGFDPAPSSSTPVSGVLPVEIPADSSIYLAWNYTVNHLSSVDGENSQILAVDDVSILGRTANPFVAWSPDGGFQKPNIVLQYDASTGTGTNWATAQNLHFYNNTAAAWVRDAVGYLREGIQKMTGQTLTVVNQADLTGATGILLTTLAAAPEDLREDPAVLAALNDSGGTDFGCETNESYYIRSEADRLIIVANRAEGLVCAVPELLESVGYAVLGMGPSWIHVPDQTAGLSFHLEKVGRPGYFSRDIWASSGQVSGQGTIYRNQANTTLVTDEFVADEWVDQSWNRWRVGSRMRTASTDTSFGHALQGFHKAVAEEIRQNGVTDGFLAPTHLGPEASRPPADAGNRGHLWINTEHSTERYGYYNRRGEAWEPVKGTVPEVALDLSVPMVREIIFEAMKTRADAAFANEPDDIYPFGTDPEDGTALTRIHLAKNPDWYADYRSAESQGWGPYALHTFKGLNQPTEMWWNSSTPPDTANAQTDTMFAFNNWLLREYDKWIDSRPPGERVTSTGKDKKSLIRCDLYSYNYHDVPPNFNLDARVRVSIAGYPKHRGRGKWLFYRNELDMAEAFTRLTSNGSFTSLRWGISGAGGSDFQMAGVILKAGHDPMTRAKRLRDYYLLANSRVVSAEADLNFGKFGLVYYLMTKVMWNPQVSDLEIEEAMDQWLQYAFGSGWQKMKEYQDLVNTAHQTVNSPNLWGRAITKINEADALIPDGTPEQQRLDELKTHWYHYYLVDTEQIGNNPAHQEFVWKAQMGYQVALRFNCREGFGHIDERLAAGAFGTGRAHYLPSETAVWWAQVMERWPYRLVTQFRDGTLFDGTPASDVDLNDLVAVAEFGSEPAQYAYTANLSKVRPSVMTTASEEGEAIGFYLFWPDRPGGTNQPKDVFWGMSRYDAETGEWEAIIDQEANYSSSFPVLVSPVPSSDPVRNVVKIEASAPGPGTYRFDVHPSANSARIVDLDWDVAAGPAAAGAPGATLGGRLTYDYAAWELSSGSSYYYFYIPKGTTVLDFDQWGGGAGRTLTIYTGPGVNDPISRVENISDDDSPRLLLPHEDGTIARFYKPPVAYLYSVPMLWAKSRSQLLVPRKIAEADGLTILP